MKTHVFNSLRLRFKEIAGFILSVYIFIFLMIDSPVYAGTTLEDPAINNAVEDAIISDEAVSYDDIDIITIDGIVTLDGMVDNLLARKRAAKIAQAVKGVRAVVNNIEVSPSWNRKDNEIEKDIEEALLFTAATEKYEVDVDVQNKIVILSGSVDSWMEKTAAEKAAMGVRGVKAITSKIEVVTKTDRSDPAIMADVEQALRWDVFVDHRLVQVRVKDRKVFLSGTVRSVAEKDEAMADARRVTGVKSVDVSDLDVDWWAGKAELRSDEFMSGSDPDIRKAVKDALLLDPHVSAFNIEVQVESGVVTLRGKVDNLRAKRAAMRDAQNTVGVLRVRNRIKVRPLAEIGDQHIATNVKAAFVRDPYLYGYDIRVRVHDNNVYLSGRVDSFLQKIRADEIAAEIRGVKTVHNRLAVHDDHIPYIFKPYIDEGNISDYDWYDDRPGYPATKPDAEIKADIQKKLFWSPFVDSDQIQVSVQNGTATLRGQVANPSEKSIAQANAFEGGAIRVINDLEIKR